MTDGTTEMTQRPLCPGGCGCELGTNDADRFECGCDDECTGWDVRVMAE